MVFPIFERLRAKRWQRVLTGEWCCEFDGMCFDTCAKLAKHMKDRHPGTAFPNCCTSDADCVMLFGPGYECVNGVCQLVTVTYPMGITADACAADHPCADVQITFTINGVSKWTPYFESLAEGDYRLVFPESITYQGRRYDLLGASSFTIQHPQNGDTYFKASYFYELPAAPVRVRFNTTEGGKVDWGEGPQDYGSTLVDVGDSITVRAIPDSGYIFNGWEVDGVDHGTGNPKTFVIQKETNIDAFFKKGIEPPPEEPPPECPFKSPFLCRIWERWRRRVKRWIP